MRFQKLFLKILPNLSMKVQTQERKLKEKARKGWCHLSHMLLVPEGSSVHEAVCYSPHYKRLSVTAGVGAREDTVSRKSEIRLEISQVTNSLSIDSSSWLHLA